MKKIGFLGGSFNPVTKAHIQLALDIIKKYDLDNVFFVPVGNFYDKAGLIEEQYRYDMLQIAIKGKEKLGVLDIELGIKQKLDAIDVFSEITRQYSLAKCYYILGADNFAKMPLWKKFDTLIQQYSYIIIQRQGYDANKIIKDNLKLMNQKEHFEIMENKRHPEVSATVIRDKIKEGNIEELGKTLDNKVYAYIREKNLYKN